MSNLNFTHSKCPLRPIKRVQFGIFSPEAIVSKMNLNAFSLYIVHYLRFVWHFCGIDFISLVPYSFCFVWCFGFSRSLVLVFDTNDYNDMIAEKRFSDTIW